ncbi:MAG: hypothetical protein MJA30_02815 [Cytophagales bacterium]|nr:hypothetical protein [Cytophagales bacterium]
MDTVKALLCLLLLFCAACGDDADSTTRLTFLEDYGLEVWEKQGLIKGDLFVAGESVPLYPDLVTGEDRKIVVNDLLEATYRFEYFVKPDGTGYWPIPRDTVFQIREGQDLTIIIR